MIPTHVFLADIRQTILSCGL